MIVECPYCATRYKVDAARLTGASPMLKCSRCRRIFPAPGSKKSPPPVRPAGKAVPQSNENLSLPFEETWKDEAEPASGPDFDVSEPEEGFTLGTEDEPPPAPAVQAETSAAPRGHSREVEDADDVEADQPDDDNEEVAPRGRARRKRAGRRQPADGERGKLWAMFIFLGLVVAGYATLTRALFASPALCDRLLGRLPLIGTLGDDRLLTRKVALSDVTGSYQRIKDGKDVFVITGKALNTAPVALRGVQLVGALYDHSGVVLDEKPIFCGNVISAKVLKDLTPQEVSILQKLSPPKRFVIEPGESSTFVIVFMDPPREAAEFSTRVLAAQRQA